MVKDTRVMSRTLKAAEGSDFNITKYNEADLNHLIDHNLRRQVTALKYCLDELDDIYRALTGTNVFGRDDDCKKNETDNIESLGIIATTQILLKDFDVSIDSLSDIINKLGMAIDPSLLKPKAAKQDSSMAPKRGKRIQKRLDGSADDDPEDDDDM